MTKKCDSGRDSFENISRDWFTNFIREIRQAFFKVYLQISNTLNFFRYSSRIFFENSPKISLILFAGIHLKSFSGIHWDLPPRIYSENFIQGFLRKYLQILFQYSNNFFMSCSRDFYRHSSMKVFKKLCMDAFKKSSRKSCRDL